MSLTTDIAALPYPELSDVPNAQTAFGNLADAIDTQVVPRFTTVAARDAAITAPTFGQLAAVSGTGELYLYNGTSWVGASPRIKLKTAAESVVSSTALQNDNELFLPVDASSTYMYRLWMPYTSTVDTNDMKVGFTFPSLTASSVYVAAALEASVSGAGPYSVTFGGATLTSGVAFTSVGTINKDVALFASGHIVVGVSSGTFQLQWAQNTSQPTSVTVKAGGYLEMWKVA